MTGKDNYKKFPRQMLRARVISEGVRAVYPGVLQGMYTPEEVQEFEAPKPVRYAKTEPVVEIVPVVEAPVEMVAEPVKKPKFATEWPVEWPSEIVEAEESVNAFLLSKGQIAEGQTFRDLQDDAYRKRVLANTAKFLAAVNAAQVKEAA